MEHCDRLAFLQRVLECAKLGVELAERVQLGQHERVIALTEAMEVEDEPTEIAVGQLTRLAQKAGAPPRAAAGTEPWPCVILALARGDGICRLAGVLRDRIRRLAAILRRR
jgi:hypothetical protein